MGRRAVWVFVVGIVLASGSVGAAQSGEIQPFDENERYWQFRGEPVVLLGGSDDDNLFQWAGPKRQELLSQLDALEQAGGNYLRNTMDDNNEDNVYPFAQQSDGQYDLNQWNTEYWDRLRFFLEETDERDIVVQLTLWDGWNFVGDRWDEHPFNPKNNVNYTTENTQLPKSWDEPPYSEDHPLMTTVPELDDDTRVLEFQKKFVRKLLSVSLPYEHVLYNVHNEDATPLEWADYWATFVHDEASDDGEPVYITGMRDDWDITADVHTHILDHPDRFDYFDASQNTWMIRRHGDEGGQVAYDHLQTVRSRIQDRTLWPINVVKLYGSDANREGTDTSTEQARHLFWVHLFAGVAAVRYHRPDYGLGASDEALRDIESARALTERFDVVAAEPSLDVLGDRSRDEAYALVQSGEAYAVYFRDGGEVTVDISAIEESQVEISWLEIDNSNWQNVSSGSGESVTLQTPNSSRWVALVEADACPNQAGETDPGICGCGEPETDGDGDGVVDCEDDCPSEAGSGPDGCPTSGHEDVGPDAGSGTGDAGGDAAGPPENGDDLSSGASDAGASDRGAAGCSCSPVEGTDSTPLPGLALLLVAVGVGRRLR